MVGSGAWSRGPKWRPSPAGRYSLFRRREGTHVQDRSTVRVSRSRMPGARRRNLPADRGTIDRSGTSQSQLCLRGEVELGLVLIALAVEHGRFGAKPPEWLSSRPTGPITHWPDDPLACGPVATIDRNRCSAPHVGADHESTEMGPEKWVQRNGAGAMGLEQWGWSNGDQSLIHKIALGTYRCRCVTFEFFWQLRQAWD